MACRFFPDGRLNFAENMLRRRDDAPALIFWGEDQVRRELSFAQLHDQVARLTAEMRRLGVNPGDRVGAVVANTPEATVAMIATQAVGGVWSSCSPDFGVEGVMDRLGQIEPRLLFATDGYLYKGKWIDTMPKVLEVSRQLPTLLQTVVLPYRHDSPAPLPSQPGMTTLEDLCSEGQPVAEIEYADRSFNDPAFILFSSGTTGLPKCIVHRVGCLLQLIKEHQLHTDVHSGDRIFYFTTCGWMMWNWLTAGLASEATLLLYDGNPFHPHTSILWDFVDTYGGSLFGTSAKYIDYLNKAGVSPRKTHDLSALRTITSTGSPLTAEAFDYVYREIKDDVCLSSISGGTDIISCFILGNPIGPVYRGEIQALGLGMAVEVYNEHGQSVKCEKGELVCTKPFPSQPWGFWHDPHNQKYKKAYFAKYDNVWAHGDFAEITDRGGVVVYGRSDAVLNPGGIRVGTAEIYREVDKLDEVEESIAVAGEILDEEGVQRDVEIVLFVKLRKDCELDEALIKKIKHQIRSNTTPRHVPAYIYPVRDIPRTKTGKVVELAVREVIHGRPVPNRSALANPDALDEYKKYMRTNATAA
mmetsp:Transcript_18098/g.51494  ORF Transcript_18098/g.51494 Transcript_18098/m.51494 type:complete len:585 (+) Transcript_18098:3-1757(+)